VEDERELEVIHHQMEQTRESLADKLEALENKVKGTVEGVEQAVSHTTEAVKETIENVKETFNIAHHVERHPWLMFTGAVGVGFLGGSLLGSSEKEESVSVTPEVPAPSLSFLNQPEGNGHTREPQRKEPSALEQGLHQLKEMALGALMGLLREVITDKVPSEWRNDVAGAVDNWTAQLGGKPLARLEHEEDNSRVQGVSS